MRPKTRGTILLEAINRQLKLKVCVILFKKHKIIAQSIDLLQFLTYTLTSCNQLLCMLRDHNKCTFSTDINSRLTGRLWIDGNAIKQ